MRRLLVWIHALPTIVFLGIGFLAYTKFVAWRGAHAANDARFVAQTVTAFKEINAENAKLQQALTKAKAKAATAVAQADVEKKTQDKILAEHPVASAPPVCAPYTTALTSCQREAQQLRAAYLALLAPIGDASKHLDKVDSVTTQGTKALKRGCGFIICPEFSVVAGGGLDKDLKGRLGIFGGIKLF
jgi:hypothetical protein